MITIPASSLAGAQIVQAGNSSNTTNSSQGTVTVTLPGNMVNAGGMVMVRSLMTLIQTCWHVCMHQFDQCVYVLDGSGWWW